MDRRAYLSSAGIVGSLVLAGCIGDNADDNEEGDNGTRPDEPSDDADLGDIQVEEVATGFDQPWGISFLPGGEQCLVTELTGTLQGVDIDAGTSTPVEGAPDVHVAGQGGLLDVTVHPDFDAEPWVYLTYVTADDDGHCATTLGRGQLADGQLNEFEELYVVEPFLQSDAHFGSRVQFDEDGLLYMTTGDRQLKEFDDDHYSQDLENALGAVLRFEADGSIPAENPFVDEDGAVDALFAYGVRNSQGLAIHPDSGELWFSEHGEQDGDELNVLDGGGNYGWPISHYGCTYVGGEEIGDEPHERDDIVDPVYYWECNSGGFPPAGMTFYDGESLTGLAGDLLVGNLAGQYLGRFAVDGYAVEEREPLLADQEWRIRDITQGPADDYLYVLVDDDDAPIVRLEPT